MGKPFNEGEHHQMAPFRLQPREALMQCRRFAFGLQLSQRIRAKIDLLRHLVAKHFTAALPRDVERAVSHEADQPRLRRSARAVELRCVAPHLQECIVQSVGCQRRLARDAHCDRVKPGRLGVILAAFRRLPAERAGRTPPRVWCDGVELDDVFRRFEAVQLAPEPVIDISGASGVPLFIAMVQGASWRGHVPGPNGLPGGYPVRLEGGKLVLDLPDGLDAPAAIAWNAAFEERDGVVVAGGRVRYTGKVAAALHGIDPALGAGFAQGFDMADFAAADAALSAARARLQQTP